MCTVSWGCELVLGWNGVAFHMFYLIKLNLLVLSPGAFGLVVALILLIILLLWANVRGEQSSPFRSRDSLTA